MSQETKKTDSDRLMNRFSRMIEKLKDGNSFLLILVALIVIVALLFFTQFITPQENDRNPLVYEIAAAVLGTLLTICVTASLLRHETNQKTTAELDKEKNVEIYKTKIETYTELMNKIEKILLGENEESEEENNLTARDVIQLQILFQKMAFVAGQDVMKKLGDFAKEFSKASSDGSSSGIEQDREAEREKVLKAFGELTVAIRFDLKDQTAEEEDEKEIQRIITASLNYIVPEKTTVPKFLASCTAEEKLYYEDAIKQFEVAGIGIEPQTKGLSFRSKEGRPIMQFYPSGSRKSIVIIPAHVKQDKLNQVKEILKLQDINDLRFKPQQLKEVARLVEIIKILNQ